MCAHLDYLNMQVRTNLLALPFQLPTMAPLSRILRKVFKMLFWTTWRIERLTLICVISSFHSLSTKSRKSKYMGYLHLTFFIFENCIIYCKQHFSYCLMGCVNYAHFHLLLMQVCALAQGTFQVHWIIKNYLISSPYGISIFAATFTLTMTNILFVRILIMFLIIVNLCIRPLSTIWWRLVSHIRSFCIRPLEQKRHLYRLYDKKVS